VSLRATARSSPGSWPGRPAGNRSFLPLDDGDTIIFSENWQKTVREFSRFSKKDAEIYPAFVVHLKEAAVIVRQLLLETPIDLRLTSVAKRSRAPRVPKVSVAGAWSRCET
jgi:phytoene dehydrogenase-like protein